MGPCAPAAGSEGEVFSPEKKGPVGTMRNPAVVLLLLLVALLVVGVLGCAASTGPEVAAASGRRKVFDVTDDEKTQALRKQNVAYVMSLSEEDMIALVPRQSGIAFTDCPNCDYGQQEWDIFDWSPEQPERITCKGCGAVYPNNPQYPDHDYLSVKAPEGEHRYHYYGRPDGYRIFFRAHADYLAGEYMAQRCQDLAELYQTTGEESYARRSALVLIRFAQVYPGWAYKYDWQFLQKVFWPYDTVFSNYDGDRIEGVPGESPRTVAYLPRGHAYTASKWSWWIYMGISREMLRAYDVLRFWPGFAGMAGGEARKLVEHDLLASMVDFVMGLADPYGNMSPHMWCDFIQAGALLDRPAWVMEALQRADFLMSAQFTYDGYWREASVGYCRMVLSDMERLLAALETYKPSQDQASPILSQIEEGRERMAGAVARLKRAYLSTIIANGMPVTINDTSPRQESERPARTESLLMPGMGLAILGGGEGERQICAWLNFTVGKVHKHFDALDIGLVAYGRELLRDIGYTHTAWRAWTVSAMAHNTVVVNGLTSDKDSERLKTRLRVFASDRRSFHLAEAESEAAYPGVATRYRRSSVLIGADSDDAYVIDIFQVTGGGQHDYLLHGSAAEDAEARVIGATLEPFDGALLNPGTAFAYPRDERSGHDDPAAYYGYVRNLRSGAAGREIIWDLRLGGEPAIGLRSHILCEPGDTVYLGEAPRIRQAEGNDELLSKFYAPFFCLRREGKHLKSVFVAVHEPVSGAPKVAAVSAQMLEGGVLVTVDRGRLGRDYFVAALDEKLEVSTSTSDGPLQLSGRYGLMRLRDGRMREGHLVDGFLFSVGPSRINGAGSWEGVIQAVSRTEGLESGGFFEVKEEIPEQASTGALVIRFPDETVRGFNIVRIQGMANGTRLYVLEDPGYETTDDSIELLYYPRYPNSPPLVGRTISGSQVRYWLPGMTDARVPGS